jgi:hypothetical protein
METEVKNMSNFAFILIISFTLIGILYWKAIQQVLLFRKNRKWTGRFVLSFVWLGLVSINIARSIISTIF